MGHLGQNPEIKHTPNGKKVATFSLATNETYIDSHGQKISETMWHSLVAWGKLADLAERFLSKGFEVCVEGKISNRNYVDKAGTKKYYTEIVLSDILLMNNKDKAKVKG